jgi:hypothetical protein
MAGNNPNVVVGYSALGPVGSYDRLSTLPQELLESILLYFVKNNGYFELAKLRLVSKAFNQLFLRSSQLHFQLFPFKQPTVGGELYKCAQLAHGGVYMKALNAKHPYWKGKGGEFKAQYNLAHGPDLALFHIKNYRAPLFAFPMEIKERKTIVVAALSHCVEHNIKYVPLRLRDDEDVMKLAVSQFPAAFRFASGRLRYDKGFLKFSVLFDPAALDYTNPALLLDRDFCLEIAEQTEAESRVPQAGAFITHFDNQLNDDSEFIRRVVSKCVLVLEYLDDWYTADHQFLFDVIADNPRCTYYLNLDDISLVRRLVLRGLSYLECATDLIQDALVVEFINFERQGSYFSFLFQELGWLESALSWISGSKNNDLKRLTVESEVFMIKIVSRVGSFLRYAAKELQDDEVVVLVATQNNPSAIEYASDRLASLDQFDWLCVDELLHINYPLVASLTKDLHARSEPQGNYGRSWESPF